MRKRGGAARGEAAVGEGARGVDPGLLHCIGDQRQRGRADGRLGNGEILHGVSRPRRKPSRGEAGRVNRGKSEARSEEGTCRAARAALPGETDLRNRRRRAGSTAPDCVGRS